MKALIDRLKEAAAQMAMGIHSPGHIAAIQEAIKALSAAEPEQRPEKTKGE